MNDINLTISNLAIQLKDLIQWETFGIHLHGIEYSDIEKITKDKSTTDERKLALYSKWLSVCPSASWNNVVTALEKEQNFGLAENIRRLTISEAECIAKNRKQISLSEEDKEEYIIDELERFSSTFKQILIRTYEEIEDLVDIKKHPLNRVLFKLETALDSTDIQGCTSIKEIFGVIRNHTHFLDSSILKQVIETVLRNSTLLQEINEHIKNVRRFKSSTPIKALKDKLKAHEIGQNKVLVVIKLKNDWEDVHFSLVENLIRNILRLKGEVNWLTVESGSIQITIAIPEQNETEAINSCSQQLELVRLMGIITMEVGTHTVVQHLEDIVDYSFETAILEACVVGNIEAVQLILETGIDVDCTEHDQGRTPLMKASEHGHENIVEDLLAGGANVNKQDNNGLTAVMVAKTVDIYETLVQANYDTNIITHKGSNPLMISCLLGNHEVANHLLFTLKHNITTRKDGVTLLMAASQEGNNDIVECLLANGHDPNLRDHDQNTAIQLSSFTGNYMITITLLSYNADPNISNTAGWTPLMCASYQGHYEIVQLLLRNQLVDPNATDESQQTAVIQASRNGHSKAVEMLSRYGQAEPNIQDHNGNTAINLSSFYGYFSVTHALLLYNADPNIPDNNGWTPLMCASYQGHYEIVQLLLRNQLVDPNATDENQQTALIQASQNGHRKAVEMLSRYAGQAEPNIQDPNGNTAIHLSSYQGYFSITKALLTYNADPSIPDNEGWTPLMSASQKGYHEVVELLLENKADPNTINKENGRTALIQASMKGHSKAVDVLLKNGAKPNIQINNGDTAISLSSFFGYFSVTKALLTYNADPNIPDDENYTPLISASQEGHYEIVQLLLENKVDPNTINYGNGRTALIQASQRGHSKVVEILLRNGAEPNIQDYYGDTAMHRSCSNSHHKVTKILLKYNADPKIPNHNGEMPLIPGATLTNYDEMLQQFKHNMSLAEYLHNEGINYNIDPQ